MIASRRLVSNLAAACLACRWLGSPPPSVAWCGEPYPPYAYTLPWFEFNAGTPSLPISMRVVGDNRPEATKHLSPLLVLPSPSLSYEYLETLEALAVSERRIAFATLSAGGEGLDALGLQAAAAVARLEARRVHVLGHGLGAAVALSLYRQQPDRLASLVLASPLAALADATPAARPELARRASPLLSTLAAPQGRPCVTAERERANANSAIALPATPPRLSASGGDGLLAEVRCPVLVTRGAADVSSEETASQILKSVPGARVLCFQDSASLPHIEEKKRYNEELLAFLDEVDGVRTRRASINDAQFPK
ncbi:hypothetical protein AB1Y20_005794 [Prymnesium parvum]|uniref:AB hydrolase-1 domain-containing protein n=1 Tax=Prymnesium parvum TaxID=97485 RepID=A0AB34J0T1_PRYPA